MASSDRIITEDKIGNFFSLVNQDIYIPLMFVDGDSMAREVEHEEMNIFEKDNVENVDLLCEACIKKFSSKELLRKHQLTHIVIASQYEQCAKSFNTKIKLKDHMKTVHSKTSDNDCQKCGGKIKARKT